MGAVPVINENDTTATDELTFGDNDVLAAQVAILLGAAWLLLLTERDGLYAATGGGAELIGDVPAGTRPGELALADFGGAPGGRGGIGSKVASASMATGGGVTTRHRVRDRGRGHPRRRLGAPRGHPLRARRSRREARVQALAALREAGHGPGRGRRRRGAGPARARHLAAGGGGGGLRGRLPGRRRGGGDLGGRRLVGKGISAMSADEVRSVAGLKSDAVRRAAARRRRRGDPPGRVRARRAPRRQRRMKRASTASPPTSRPRAGCWRACRARTATPCSRRWPRRSSGARARSCARTARTCRRPSAARSRRRSSTGCCSTRTAWPTWRPGSARSRRCPTRSGRSTAGRRLPNGLDVVRRRVPLGVVAVVYEGRPNVTADAAALCVKSGNAVILRGSRVARRSNLILAEVLTGALIEADAPRWGARPAGHRPRGAAPAGAEGGRGRPRHPARRRGPEGLPARARAGAGGLRGRPATTTSTSTPAADLDDGR